MDNNEELNERIEKFLKLYALNDKNGDLYVEFSDIIRADFEDYEIEYVITYLKEKGINYHIHDNNYSKSQTQIEHNYFGTLAPTFEELLKINQKINKNRQY